jgi:hypothetical protein
MEMQTLRTAANDRRQKKPTAGVLYPIDLIG